MERVGDPCSVCQCRSIDHLWTKNHRRERVLFVENQDSANSKIEKCAMETPKILIQVGFFK